MQPDPSMERTFASFYDFYDAAEYRRHQIEAYSRLAHEADGPVLELACGTGIIALELARKGIDVTGVDISPAMLDIFRGKLNQEEETVRRKATLIQGDMKDLEGLGLSGGFSAVFIPNNAFGYLTSTDAQRQCLSAVSSRLPSGGILVVEERFYTPEILMGMLSRRAAPMNQMSRVNPRTGKFTSFHSMTVHIDFAGKTITGARYIEELQEDGTVHRVVPENGGHSRSRYFSRFELELLFEGAGLEVMHLWGGYDRQPFSASSRSMIFVCRKP